MSFKRVRGETAIVYSTAIAHSISARCQLPLTQVMQQMVDSVSGNTLNSSFMWRDTALPKAIYQDIAVRATPSGLIQFELGDRAIAAWLDLILQSLPTAVVEDAETRRRGDTENFQSIHPLRWHRRLFAVQHAYARCCSLLRLAHREGVIVLNQPDAHPSFWQWVAPIPWLNPNFQLELAHSSEQRLIDQIFRGLDAIFAPLTEGAIERYLSLAEEISQRFGELHASYPVFNQTSTQWGLIMITQCLLRILLESGLGVDALPEL